MYLYLYIFTKLYVYIHTLLMIFVSFALSASALHASNPSSLRGYRRALQDEHMNIINTIFN